MKIESSELSEDIMTEQEMLAQIARLEKRVQSLSDRVGVLEDIRQRPDTSNYPSIRPLGPIIFGPMRNEPPSIRPLWEQNFTISDNTGTPPLQIPPATSLENKND